MNQLKEYPNISIIIPVYNDVQNIMYLLNSIEKLDYPKQLYEVIIVDNNSNDNIEDSIARYDIRLLREEKIQSSYAARNKGILSAKGEVIAFTDSDCIVHPAWLKNGIRTMNKGNGDMVGGKIQFYYSKKTSGSELYDSLMFMQNELYVKKEHKAATANLIVKANLFNKYGLFPVVKSGGDSIWTLKASKGGAHLLYSKEAIVYHPARTFQQLLIKCLRVGKGGVSIRKRKNKNQIVILLEAVRMLVPIRIKRIKILIETRGVPFMRRKLSAIWYMANICNIAICIGLIAGLLNDARNRPEQE